jgi:hypothetical protein
MNIKEKQIKLFSQLIDEYSSFNERIENVLNQIQKLEIERVQLTQELEAIKIIEENLYEEIALDNNSNVDEVKSYIVNFLLG